MLRKETLDIVGYFDEQFHPFNYEDVDYWTRIFESGHTIARDYSVQVRHDEGQVIHSFEDNGFVDAQNRQRYLEKWGFDPIPILYGTEKFPWEE
jgi:GT2 family glycosyltransferase